MKIIKVLSCLLFLATIKGGAQQIISIDLGYSHNIKKSLQGINISSFYHFSERVTCGLEMNRFFNHHLKGEEGEDISVSALDFDLNLHYNIRLSHHLYCYPLTGISHTSEKETVDKDETHYKRFYSVNAGAGVFLKLKKLIPFAEYMYTRGEMNQQFFLVGVGYELEFARRH